MGALDAATSTIRFSLGEETTAADVDTALAAAATVFARAL
jgi:cysteine sulfinate desulfinase/cysteine desulfurase-like protein